MNNCRLSVANYGQVAVRATRVVHGMSIVSYGGEPQSRNGKAFYSSKRTSGSFDLQLIFSSHRRYRQVAEWLERYGRWVANPGTDASPMRVTIPSRNFDKTAALTTGVTFGDVAIGITYTMNLAFMGSRDPLDLSSRHLSTFAVPDSDDPALPHLYPGGTQTSGDVNESWDNAVYDGPDLLPSVLAPEGDTVRRR